MLQAGWGKRWSPDDEWSLSENSDNEPQQYDDYGVAPPAVDLEDLRDDEKRTWRSLNSPWGKRATQNWGSFRGCQDITNYYNSFLIFHICCILLQLNENKAFYSAGV